VTVERDRITAMLRNWDARRRTEAVERISDAIGRKPMDEEGFVDDLYEAAVYADALDPLEEKLAAERLKLLRRIRKLAEKVTGLTKTDWWIRAGVGDNLPTPDTLRRMEAWQARLKEGSTRKGCAENDRRITANESLAGVTLPVIFETHFGGTVKYRRDGDGTPEGEVIAFVETAMRELGRFYSRGAIGKAITAFRARRDEYRSELNRRNQPLGKIGK
jgi:hypothetical protein